MNHQIRFGPAALAAVLVGALIGCQAAPAAPTPNPSLAAATVSPSPARTAAPTLASMPNATASTIDPWAEDLAALDHGVRSYHPEPFAIHTEAEWSSRLAEIATLLPAAAPDEQMVYLASLIGLLDSHSGLFGIGDGLHYYGFVLYRFPEGWFVVRAEDEALVGSRLVSIGGVGAVEIEDRLEPLVPNDNDSSLMMGMEWLISSVEYLHGTHVVSDLASPTFVLERPDGDQVTVDPSVMEEGQYERRFDILGALLGDAPEAVARRGERIWTRLVEEQRTFLVSVNDYGDMSAAIEAMTSAVASDDVDRVVVDMRYLRGGNGDIGLLDVLIDDQRINRPGGLVALIGRENESAATKVAYLLDTQTNALLVGEPTHARANNFTCPCQDIRLPNSGFIVSVPLHQDYEGDPRPEIAPDVPMSLSSIDFFAGLDPVLEAVLADALPTITP